MLAEVGPWWLVGLLVVGATALLGALIAALRGVSTSCRGHCARPSAAASSARLRAPSLRSTSLGHGFDWAVRYQYALPVSATFLQQARFVLAASTADPNRDLPGLPLPKSDLGRLDGDDVLLLFLESYGAVTYDEPADCANRCARARRARACGRRERTAHRVGLCLVADVRRRLVARARELHERRRSSRHRRLHAAADARARDVAEAVQGRGLPRGRRHARHEERLARGRVLRLRHDLRRARSRVPRPRVRLVADPGPVLARARRGARALAATRTRRS